MIDQVCTMYVTHIVDMDFLVVLGLLARRETIDMTVLMVCSLSKINRQGELIAVIIFHWYGLLASC